MRALTAALLVAFVVGLAAAGGVALTGVTGDAELAPIWISDTGRDVSANHHAPAFADGTVFAPVSSDDDEAGSCALYALDAGDGGVRWRSPLPAANCTIHSVADPAVADANGDGEPEVLAATTERELASFDPETGEKTAAHPLPNYGYTRPIVADLAPSPGAETIVVDTTGTVLVLTRDGREAWRVPFGAYTFAQPSVADFDADGSPELLVAARDGTVALLDGSGETRWRLSGVGSVSWATVGDVDDDPAREAVLATIEGRVVAIDGRDGRVEWRHDGGEFAFASVHALDDGDADGTTEVYVATRDGRITALSADSGAVEWRTALVAEGMRMMPPPSMGDLDGDGGPELLAPANDGTVSVVDPATGDVLATYGRDASIFTHATLADVDGDGDEEAVVVYADGRVVALDYRS
jgi:outer membrane protein assembly factor BamB